MTRKETTGTKTPQSVTGGGALPPGGPIKYTLPPTHKGETGLEWYGTPPEVGREGGGGRWGRKAVLVAAGCTHSVVVAEGRGVWACGLNNHGQLGVGICKTVTFPRNCRSSGDALT